MFKAGDVLEIGLGGNFKLIDNIANSSFGEIWSASWLETNHRVALKMLHRDAHIFDEPMMNQYKIDCLKKELKIMQSIRAGHLLKMFRHGLIQGMPVLVLEELDCTLKQSISITPPNLLTILDWLRQIAEGLQVLHNIGWRHLDIKPNNLMFDASKAMPRLRVVDFGASAQKNTKMHELLGTIGWMAPEQFIPFQQHGNQYLYKTDHRADIYALGLLLFYMLTGKQTQFAKETLAFHKLNPEHAAWAKREVIQADLMDEDRATLSDAIRRHLDETIGIDHHHEHANFISKMLSHETHSLNILINGLLQHNPLKRFQDMSSVLASIAVCDMTVRRNVRNKIKAV